jgi:hypothetical protein
MDWKVTLEIFAVIGGVATVFGLFLAPMFWLGSKIDAMRTEMHEESKDFHARLCAIEERNKR